MPHAHQHFHDESQKQEAQENQKTLLWVLLLTLLYLVLEIAGGLLSGSLALIADGFHMLADAMGIIIALFASWLSAQKPPVYATFGYARVGVVAAMLNALLILGMATFILYECYHRIQSPTVVQGPVMLGIAIGGLLVNLIAAKLLHQSHQHNLNMKGAYLHVLSDLLGSAGAIVASIIVLWFHWYWIDPLVSLLVAALLLFNGGKLLKECLNIFMETAPEHVPVPLICDAIMAIDGIEGIHHFHAWPLTMNDVIVTAHLIVTKDAYHPETVLQVERLLNERFHLSHVTLQLELAPDKTLDNTML